MLNTNWTLSAVMLAAAFAGTASQASAQTEHYRGNFELTFEARFGNAVLPPGHYTVSTLEGARGIRITGDTKSVAILAAGYELTPGTANAKMILVDSNGTYALETFESGAMGKSLHFYVKKSRGTVESASAKQAKPAIEVAMQ